jgi:hypothetical protein
MRVTPKCRRDSNTEGFRRRAELDDMTTEEVQATDEKPSLKHRRKGGKKRSKEQVCLDIRSQKKIMAAAMIGEGRYTLNEVAQTVGMSRRQLLAWKSHDEFKVMVNNSAEAYAKRFLSEGLAKKERRLAVLNDMHERITTAVFERGESDDMAEVPGGRTGLVTRTLKGIGKGDDFQVVEVYNIDTPVVDSLISIHKAVRDELGQNIMKHEFSNPDGSPIQPPKITVQVLQVVNKKDKKKPVAREILMPPADEVKR